MAARVVVARTSSNLILIPERPRNYDRREDDEEDRVDPGIIRLSRAPSVDGDHPALMLRFALTKIPVCKSMSVGPEVKFALLF